MTAIRIPREEVRELRLQRKTYEEIGLVYGVTRQRIYQIVTDWSKKYAKSDTFKEYRRHNLGHTKPYKPCKYCKVL